jgi:hypothetical protein
MDAETEDEGLGFSFRSYAQNLAAGEVADGEDAPGGENFFAQPGGCLIVKFTGAVKGERPGNLPAFGGEQGDAGDGSAEVDVQVMEGVPAHPATEQKRFREVSQAKRPRDGGAWHGGDGAESAQCDGRVKGERGENGGDAAEPGSGGAKQGSVTRRLEVKGGGGFLLLFEWKLAEWAVRGIDGGGVNLESTRAESDDFAQEKSVGDSGIDAQQIGQTWRGRSR